MENKFAVGNSLPKVDYRTLVDCYVDVCCLCIFISAFSAFITKFVYEEDHDEELAWEVNGILFAINISILFVAVIYVCVRVRNVHDGISEWLGHAETRRKEINSSECIVEDIDAASNSDKKNHKRDRRASAFLDVGGGRKTHSKTSSNNNKYRILNALADAKVMRSCLHVNIIFNHRFFFSLVSKKLDFIRVYH